MKTPTMFRLKSFALLMFVGFASSLLAGSSNQVFGQTVVFSTSLGDIQVELDSDAAPITVQNFLSYANADAGSNYDGSFFHRSIDGFILQGGGFYTPVDFNVLAAIPRQNPIVNEFGISNTRGTIAMAKVGGDPDSATNQWFFNTADNSENLDFQNGGFTVFGTVTSGMDVVDAIQDLATFNIRFLSGAQITDVPLINDSPEFVLLNRITLLGDVNLDGTVDLFDIAPFISVLTSGGGFQAEADTDLSSQVNLFDIAPFIGLLTGQ